MRTVTMRITISTDDHEWFSQHAKKVGLSTERYVEEMLRRYVEQRSDEYILARVKAFDDHMETEEGQEEYSRFKQHVGNWEGDRWCAAHALQDMRWRDRLVRVRHDFSAFYSRQMVHEDLVEIAAKHTKGLISEEEAEGFRSTWIDFFDFTFSAPADKRFPDVVGHLKLWGRYGYTRHGDMAA